MKIKFENIEWDSDENLPSEVEIVVGRVVDVESEGAEILASEFGECVKGFQFSVEN